MATTREFYTIKRSKGRVLVNFHYMPEEDRQRRFDDFLRTLSKVFEPKTNFTMMFNVTAIGVSVPLSFAKSLVGWMKKMEPQIVMYLDKTAVVVSNEFIKIFLRAVFNVRKPKKPQSTFTDVREASKWLKW